MQPIGILLVGSQTIFRTGLKKLLAREPDLKIVGDAAEAEEGADLADRLQPQIVLIDLTIPETQVDGLLARLSTECQGKVIMMASASEQAYIIRAFLLGAHGAVMKDSAAAVLIQSIRSVAGGFYWAADHAVEDRAAAIKHLQARAREPSRRKFGLTRREIQILSAIASARSNRQIANKLSISEETVKHHVTHLFDKLGVYNRLELTLFAIHHELLER